MLMDNTINELKTIMASIVIKHNRRGEGIDTKESKYNADRFISAKDKTDRFETYTYFEPDAILNAGLASNESDAANIAINPSGIPREKRDRVLEEQRKVLIANYVEINPYFRMLNGQPPLGKIKHYASMEFYRDYNIEMKPVYKFNVSETSFLIASGEIDAIRARYTEDIEYLDYLGDKKIDPYYSRKAHNFQILRADFSSNSTIAETFVRQYEDCRVYVMNVLYVSQFAKTKPYYDEYMALMVNVIAAQRTVVEIFTSGLNRDFFDLEMIKALLESYNVPYISSMSRDHLLLLCQNLNKLLHYKSTDRVLFDILDIMGFDSANIFKYYLVKNHILDDNGIPVFDYVDDGNGNMIPNYRAMYDIHYKTIPITEANEELELSNPLNRTSYDEVATLDPYWWDEDSELLQKLYEEEFNYIDTKYIGLNLMFKITEVLFEVIHVFKIIRDNAEAGANIEVNFDRLTPGVSIDLFSLFNFGMAVMCKRKKLKGEIISKHSKVMSLIGFDFDADFDQLRTYIQEQSRYIKSENVLSFIKDVEVLKLSDVDRMFVNIRGLWEFLSKELAETEDIVAYNIYNKLYDTLYISEYVDDMFTKRNGEVAATYLDMLSDLRPDLVALIEDAEDAVLDEYINYIISKLQEVYGNSQYLSIVINDSSPLLDALSKLINFFKSYTVSLRKVNVYYVLDHPHLHGVKMLSYIKKIVSKFDVADDLLLHDLVQIVSRMDKEHLFTFTDKLRTSVYLRFIQEAIVLDTMRLSSRIKMDETIDTVEYVMRIRKILGDKMMIDLRDYMSLSANLRFSDDVTLNHMLESLTARIREGMTVESDHGVNSLSKSIEMKDFLESETMVDRISGKFTIKDEAFLQDIISAITGNLRIGSDISFETLCNYIMANIIIGDELIVRESIRVLSHINVDMSLIGMKLYNVTKNLATSEKVMVLDTVMTIINMQVDDRLNMWDTVSKVSGELELYREGDIIDDTISISTEVRGEDRVSLMDVIASYNVSVNLRERLGFNEIIKIVR